MSSDVEPSRSLVAMGSSDASSAVVVQGSVVNSVSAPPQLSIDESFCPRAYAWLQVEDTIYKVCLSHLTDGSPFFYQRLSRAAPEGLSQEAPLRLEGIVKGEFTQFMRLAWRKIPGADELLTKNQLIAALKCACLWNFVHIRQYVIQKLEGGNLLPGGDKHGNAEMVGLAQLYGIDSWLRPALLRLAERELPLDNHEFELMGPDTALKLMRLRERHTVQCANHCKMRNSRRPFSFSSAPTLPAKGPFISLAGAATTAQPVTSQRCDYDYTKDLWEIFPKYYTVALRSGLSPSM